MIILIKNTLTNAIKNTVKLLLCFWFLSSTAFADISLPRLISDGVILQRDSENLIWGWAEVGEKVTVKLDGKIVAQLVADQVSNDNKNAIWSFKLPAQAAGGAHQIIITGMNEGISEVNAETINTIVINDIYFGDVWLASGQSNMQLTMARVKVKYPEEVAQANFPQLRHFVVPGAYDFNQPLDDVKSGQWQAVNNTTIEKFSAVGYFFAKQLHQKHQIPIGIINSSYGGSPTEAWMSEQALKQFPHYLEVINKYRQVDYLKNLKASDKQRSDNWYKQLHIDDLGLAKGNSQKKSWYEAGYDASAWQQVNLPSFWQDQGIPLKNGVIWFKKTFQLSKSEAQLSGLLSLGRIVDADKAYINGIEVGNTSYQYPPRRYSIDKNIFKAGENTITVRVVSNIGKGGFVNDKPYFVKVGQRTIDLQGSWHYKIGAKAPALAGPSFQQYKQPLGFYNAMLAPVLKTTIKGVIWYQGESNTDRPQEYTQMFPAMIRNWRQQFNQGDFPFIYVQLANFMAEQAQPIESGWAETREGQRLALSEPNTAMAVILDTGEWNDIHPLDKKTVGDRLALAAEKLAYGNNKVVYSGPEIKSMQINANKAVLTFELFGSELAVRDSPNNKEKLKGFAIAGSDGKFVWANAKIENNQVIVWSDAVNTPVHVRYAWADNPATANLVNKAGLPASSFQIMNSKTGQSVSFDWFEYQGHDAIFNQPLAEGRFQNPILAGFYPDPSITRKGDDYYMATSSFAYAPGVPILHSKDLVNWQLIGHALTNNKQLNYPNTSVSEGAFAPTLRYHNGLFYMINTAVAAGGNFFVTAKDPTGEWSEPYWLPEIGGIDPDIFFDDDGKVYIAHNNGPEGKALYQGHRAIWLWEYDLTARKVIKDSGRVIVDGGVELSKKPIWIEAPHLYKINGWYYLLCAEGGTGSQHSAVIFRTRSLKEPFLPYQQNPILTQRDLNHDRVNPISSAGHADIIQTASGEWWAVFLATRPYEKDFYNTGRETFLLPVNWQNEWPHILPQGEEIPYQVNKPVTMPITKKSKPVNADKLTGNFIWRDDFTASQLNPHWNMLRSTNRDWYQLNNGKIHLTPSTVKMTTREQPVYLGRRQQHMTFQASSALSLPKTEGVSAGLVAFQNDKYHYYLGVKKQALGYQIFLEQVRNGEVNVLKSMLLNTGVGAGVDVDIAQSLTLTIKGDKGLIDFAYQVAGKDKVIVAEQLDATMLSTAVAQGFVGTTLGIYSRIEGIEK